ADTIFKPINDWLFAHIGFWSGFRDSQKWSGLLVLSYAYFATFGAYAFIEKVMVFNFKIWPYARTAIFVFPIIFTYTVWGGFARQIQPVWYPEEWHQVNEILNSDSDDFKVLFLPWHQYLSLDFNNYLISINPARSFFDKHIIQGENMEIGYIFSQSADSAYMDIERAILNEKQSPEAVLGFLVDNNIKYIINYKNLTNKDYIQYNFLNSPNLLKTEYMGLTLFEIRVK
ncbi:MAG: hypothetical protein U9Q85_01930, partial [Patescibacteria group bacterium]|nr:hypothetical protein [Patescibacteria group bacterium]